MSMTTGTTITKELSGLSRQDLMHALRIAGYTSLLSMSRLQRRRLLDGVLGCQADATAAADLLERERDQLTRW